MEKVIYIMAGIGNKNIRLNVIVERMREVRIAEVINPEKDALYIVKGAEENFGSSKEFFKRIEQYKSPKYEEGKTNWENLEFIENQLERLSREVNVDVWCDGFYRNICPPSFAIKRGG